MQSVVYPKNEIYAGVDMAGAKRTCLSLALLSLN